MKPQQTPKIKNTKPKKNFSYDKRLKIPEKCLMSLKNFLKNNFVYLIKKKSKSYEHKRTDSENLKKQMDPKPPKKHATN